MILFPWESQTPCCCILHHRSCSHATRLAPGLYTWQTWASWVPFTGITWHHFCVLKFSFQLSELSLCNPDNLVLNHIYACCLGLVCSSAALLGCEKTQLQCFRTHSSNSALYLVSANTDATCSAWTALKALVALPTTAIVLQTFNLTSVLQSSQLGSSSALRCTSILPDSSALSAWSYRFSTSLSSKWFDAVHRATNIIFGVK